jgi:rhodanese-related sulfurtransferase
MTTAAVSRVQDVSPSEVKSLLDTGEITLIDVREPAEHAAMRIAGAKIVPLSKFDPQQLPGGIAGASRVILHCRSGNRSAKAAQLLLDAGASEVRQLAGGILAWQQAGLPVEKDPKAPIDVMRQVQITAGSLVMLGVALGWFVSPWFFILSAFVGAGLAFAGITNTCGMAMMLSKMPWNRRTT